jgi:hypothetical protein
MLDRVKALQCSLVNFRFCGGKSKQRRETVMKNNYEASVVFEFGQAHNVVMGTKPEVGEIDAVLGFPYRIEPDSNDIDESDE